MVLMRVVDDMSDNLRQVTFPKESYHSSGFLSYSYLCGAGAASDSRLIEIPENRLRSLLSIFLDFVYIDETWYLEVNPDVAKAIQAGEIESARMHYAIAGFYENRWPYPIIVDELWYRTEYPDVETAIKRGGVDSCQDHFNRYGFLEGRLPSPGWSLLSRQPPQTDVQQD